jgi:hypothetical protein
MAQQGSATIGAISLLYRAIDRPNRAAALTSKSSHRRASVPAGTTTYLSWFTAGWFNDSIEM